MTEIEGGTASNIVPVPCWFGWEMRGLPGFDAMPLDQRLRRFAADHCLPEMQRAAPETGIAIDITNEVPAFQGDSASEAIPLAMNLAGRNERLAVCYATEASLFQIAGASSVVCGPGDIAQAHTPNEYLRVDQLEECLAFLDRLAAWATR